MRMKLNSTGISIGMVFTLVLMGCGGGGSSPTTPTTPTTPITPTTPT
ncbi:MAG: hypothetical protein HOO97_11415, partial [Sideroxydans sp.]|nr:hypothetical protein [Sideroxydans sp.]